MGSAGEQRPRVLLGFKGHLKGNSVSNSVTSNNLFPDRDQPKWMRGQFWGSWYLVER